MAYDIAVYPPELEPFSEVKDALVSLGVSFNEFWSDKGVFYRASASQEQLEHLKEVAEETGGFVLVESVKNDVKEVII